MAAVLLVKIDTLVFRIARQAPLFRTADVVNAAAAKGIDITPRACASELVLLGFVSAGEDVWRQPSDQVVMERDAALAAIGSTVGSMREVQAMLRRADAGVEQAITMLGRAIDYAVQARRGAAPPADADDTGG